MLQMLIDRLGSDLYTACIQNNVAQVKAMVANQESTDWAAAVVAAASREANDVVAYCLSDQSSGRIIYDALWWIIYDEALDPAYRFMVECKFVDVNYEIDRTGSVLGVLAGNSKQKRHSLIRYILEKGGIPNEWPEIEGGMHILTAAAGHSDRQMLELLIDHGAEVNGNGALALAAQCGKIDNVRCLLSRGAKVNEMAPYSSRARNPEDIRAPLHNAAKNGHVDVIGELLKAGADVKLQDPKGRTAADIAIEKGLDAQVLAKLS